MLMVTSIKFKIYRTDSPKVVWVFGGVSQNVCVLVCEVRLFAVSVFFSGVFMFMSFSVVFCVRRSVLCVCWIWTVCVCLRVNVTVWLCNDKAGVHVKRCSFDSKRAYSFRLSSELIISLLCSVSCLLECTGEFAVCDGESSSRFIPSQ